MAKIQLNGKKITLKSGTSLRRLIKKYKMNEKKIAVELNGKIVSKAILKNRILKNNDKVELVHFIGGG
tara:strand:- start:1635 stop:1838 length:204 start_codon:yes stop_codon:yes gene_type:complete